ncbi:MAG: hypothetical protein GY925_29825, partial [Actinomycetia bacterium]|nr:hypothetical protein [Actinomycetes bacterium]
IKLDRNGAWIAEELGQRLADGLVTEPECELPKLLESCIAELVDTYELAPGHAPSTTVSMVRLANGRLEVMVLCDSPVIVLDTDGRIHQVRDDRLDEVVRSIERPPGKPDMTDARWIRTVEAFESHRNQPGGFWVPSATPEAARHAIQQTFNASTVDTAVLLTDGASAGVDDYGVPPTWLEGVQVAKRSADEFITLVQTTEESDPDCTRWPRTKPHDDKSIAVLQVEV